MKLQHGSQEAKSPASDQFTLSMEGKGCTEKPMTMLVQGDFRPDFIALRTVPIKLRNGHRLLRVNAMLDDASTNTYVNADDWAFIEERKR